jgi:ATP-dependent Clp protease ATP-binding subunit ClpA
MDFYQFFSFSAKKAIYRANETCVQFKNQYLKPEHVLYSILKLRSCSGVQLLLQLGVDLPKLTYALEAHLYQHSGSYKGQATFSKRTIEVLDTSMKEVKRLHHREIGTTHLLIALAQESSTFLRSLFAEHHLDDSKIRDAFMSHLKGYADQLGKPVFPAPVYPVSQEKSVCDKDWNAAVGGGYFNVLSSAVRHAVTYAFSIAQLLRNYSVVPEHVLYLMISDVQSNVSRMLEERGADRGAIMSELYEYLRKQRATNSPIKPKLGQDLLRALSQSYELMARLRRPEINSTHMLVSMLQIPGLEVRRVFDKHNLTERILEDARHVVAEVTGEEPSGPPSDSAAAGNTDDSAENPSEDNGEDAADED